MAVAAVRESRICGDQDRELVEALRLRKSAAAERLVAAHGSRAYRWAERVTGQAADAEEVVQDAFWAVVRKIDTFQPEIPRRRQIRRAAPRHRAILGAPPSRRANAASTRPDRGDIFTEQLEGHFHWTATQEHKTTWRTASARSTMR